MNNQSSSLSKDELIGLMEETAQKNGWKSFKDTQMNLKFSECNALIDVNCSAVCPKEITYTSGTKAPNEAYDEQKCREACQNKSSITRRKDSPKVIGTTCASWNGNSGGASFSAETGELVAICSGGIDGFTDDRDQNYAVSAFVLHDVIAKIAKKHPPKTEPAAAKTQTDARKQAEEDAKEAPEVAEATEAHTSQELAGAGNDETEKEVAVAKANAEYAQQGITAAKQRIERRLSNGEITADDVVPLVDDVVTIDVLQEEYRKAKEKEQSLANRTLTALTMAATGIGGMELARGLAEQKADKAAEADMTAYMSTFQCKVGDKRYTGNDTQIEIAGGNELIKLYQEYVDLANSLKERKAALGKKAGIESEVILDKANMGLYDETGKGIENGTYASLYRAARGNENDAAKIQEQKDASKKRVIAGAVVAGAGVVGGMVGNILINGKSENDNNSTIAETYTANANNTHTEEEEEYEEEQLENQMNGMASGAPVNTRTPGCTVNSSVSTIPDACKSHYASDTNEQARCNKCVNNAGTYEGGRCYIEVIGWACLGKGWPQDNKPNSPAPCATAANRYQDCHIVRKYADAEKPFTCDPMSSIAPGKTALVSGCGQHGWSVGDKHPPFNLDGPNAVGQNCKLPLSSNMAWRKMYSKGSAIGVTFSGKTVTTGRWCMPSANSSPWNDSNHSGAAKHLLSSSLMAGGESKDKWFSLD